MSRNKSDKSGRPSVKPSVTFSMVDFVTYIFICFFIVFIIIMSVLDAIDNHRHSSEESANVPVKFSYIPVTNAADDAKFVYKLETAHFVKNNFDGKDFRVEKFTNALISVEKRNLFAGYITAELTADSIESVLSLNSEKRCLPSVSRPEKQNPLKVRVNPQGQLIERSGGTVEKGLQPLFFPVIFPEGEKMVGDVWETPVQQEFEVFPQTTEAEGGWKIVFHVLIDSELVSYDAQTGDAVVREGYTVTRITGVRKFFKERLNSEGFDFRAYSEEGGKGLCGNYRYNSKTGVIIKLDRRLNYEVRSGEFYVNLINTTKLELLKPQP